MPRYLALALPICLVVVLGCAPSKSDIDKSLREEMKSKLNVEITSTSLTKQSDGGYIGTATASNGDVYDVTVSPPSGGRTEWQAVPAQALVEKKVTEFIEGHYKSKVKTLNLTKQKPGVYTGTAVLDIGAKFNVSTSLEGTQLMVKTDPIP